MRVSSAWISGAALSAATHAVLAVAAVVLFAARPVGQQSPSQSRLELATLAVPVSAAPEQEPGAEPATERLPAAGRSGIGAPPASDARQLPTLGSGVTALAAVGESAAPAELQSAVVVLESSEGQAAPVVRPPATALPGQAVRVPAAAPADASVLTGSLPEATPPDPQRLAARPVTGQAVLPVVRKDTPAPDSAPALVAASAKAPKILAALATAAPGERIRPGRAAVQQSTEAVPAFPRVASRPFAPAAATRITPEAPRAPALLAWSGDFSLELRQETIEAAAALRVSDPDPGGQVLRDGLKERLAGVDCARAQTGYDPLTGTLGLYGHVRTDQDRDALVAALESQLDGTIPVIDRLRRLDAPQCTVLTSLADLPLPQSVEQFTNPLILGEDLQARVYSFGDGDAMRFELQGADYQGWLYLDYYDSEGRVLHLIPNSAIPPLMLSAEENVVFGGGGPDDIARGKLELRVSPPFGQDIAVAFVSNRRLFDTPRATTEPADVYLAELSRKVGDIRQEHDDFRGEWVYLLVETGRVAARSDDE